MLAALILVGPAAARTEGASVAKYVFEDELTIDFRCGGAQGEIILVNAERFYSETDVLNPQINTGQYMYRWSSSTGYGSTTGTQYRVNGNVSSTFSYAFGPAANAPWIWSSAWRITLVPIGGGTTYTYRERSQIVTDASGSTIRWTVDEIAGDCVAL